MKFEYITDTFSCALSTKNAFNDKLQTLLNFYGKAGWKLHTVQVVGATASICICVFEKQK